MSGLSSYLKGQAAEHAVARFYEARGLHLVAQRWHARGGEIDLIMRQDDTFVFIEVKASRDFLRAAQRVSHAQLQRIHHTASAFLENQPLGALTPSRFDVALVNALGEIEIIENALAY